MREYQTFDIKDTRTFKEKVLLWAKDQKVMCYLNSNVRENPKLTSQFEYLFGVDSVDQLSLKLQQASKQEGSFERLKNFYNEKQDWLFGYFTYDLKNELEDLKSENEDHIQFPKMHFFQPRYIFIIRKKSVTIGYIKGKDGTKGIEAIFEEVSSIKSLKLKVESLSRTYDVSRSTNLSKIQAKISKEKYLQAVEKIKEHIQRGDIYELNFCQEFFAENATINPIQVYNLLNEASPMPFSAYYRLDNRYLICASPERFIRKEQSKITSQPIKGTIQRGKDSEEDNALKKQLQEDEKERSENVMIVDLVRNDLSRTAERGSVKVDELCEVYSFNQVHQLISTVSAKLKKGVHFIDAIKHAFPMGSMTGAPKVRAMELIEAFESTKRGLYSGAVGYIAPHGDFDFNVVIRSILYNADENYLSFMVGGAITAKSAPEKEYEECLVKAKAMLEVFEN